MAFRNNKQMTSRVPCCPHCNNLNQYAQRRNPAAVLVPTNHYLREFPDPSSRVVCPELLRTQCKGCGKLGHTISACKETIKRSSDARRRQAYCEKSASVSVSALTNVNNTFACLDEDSEYVSAKSAMAKPLAKPWTKSLAKPLTINSRFACDTDQIAAMMHKDFPELSRRRPAAQAVAPAHVLNFSQALASKPLPSACLSQAKPQLNLKDCPLFTNQNGVCNVSTKNWADYDDEEENDEYDNFLCY